MSRRVVQVACVAALAALALLLRARRPASPATPEATVVALFDAAEKGDDAAYLARVGGELRRSLENTRSQVGAEAFRRNLRQSAAGVKGLGVSRAAEAPGDSVALDVEITFANRKEIQRFLVSPQDGGWAIVEISSAVTTQPAIPYGTPVYAE